MIDRPLGLQPDVADSAVVNRSAVGCWSRDSRVKKDSPRLCVGSRLRRAVKKMRALNGSLVPLRAPCCDSKCRSVLPRCSCPVEYVHTLTYIFTYVALLITSILCGELLNCVHPPQVPNFLVLPPPLIYCRCRAHGPPVHYSKTRAFGRFPACE